MENTLTHPDATELLRQLRSDETTSHALVSQHLNRLEQLNPALNATTTIFKNEALAQAAQPKPGPLSGLPITIKECYAWAGGEVTLGSVRMPPIATPNNAVLVQKLLDAGAIVIARTNIAEFLLDRESDNLRFGRTNNCFNAALTCGGSSGGEGALVGSGCSAAGIGTDIGGSIRVPAAFNGLVGFKPTSEALDKTGVFGSAAPHFVETCNAAGPLARSVRDVRLLYNVLAKKPVGEPLPIAGKTLIVPSDFQFKLRDDSIARALAEGTNGLLAKGLIRKEAETGADSGQLYNDFMTMMIDAFLPLIYEWTKTADGKAFSLLSEIFRKMLGKPSVSHALFMTTLGVSLLKPSAKKAKAAIENVQSLRDKYSSLLGEDGLMILPTLGVLATPHGKINAIGGKPGVIREITPTTFCNTLNLPAITVPAWKFQRDAYSSPPGVMLVAAPGSEGLLLDSAAALEEVLK